MALALLACSPSATGGGATKEASAAAVPVATATVPVAPPSLQEPVARSLPVVPVAASLCEAVGAAAFGAESSEVARSWVAAERAACNGQSSEAVNRWRLIASQEPRLSDITNRRIAQVSGGGQRGGAPAQTLAGLLMSAPEGDFRLDALKRDERWLFALEPAPWVRGKVDAVRWRRFAEQSGSEVARAWARGWLMETDTGETEVWLARFTALREQPGLSAGDRRMLSGRCVDRLLDGVQQPLSAVARARLLPLLERCIGADPISEGLSGDGGGSWLLGEVAESDATGRLLAERESQWRTLMVDRRGDLDGAALEIAASLGEVAEAWRGGESLLACVELAEALGASSQAERCMEGLGRLETALVWDHGLRAEVALQRALRSRGSQGAMAAIAETGSELSATRRSFVLARAGARPSALRDLIVQAPLSYEAVFADRLLRQDGGAGVLASKLAALRFASASSAPMDSGWAAEWLAAQGLLSLARSEALLQAEVEGAENPRLWGVAADLLSRNGEFALAHAAARRLTGGLGAFPEVMAMIPGRVWREAYPVRWEKEIAMASKRQGVPQSLLLAFLRRESGFDADARSEVGARGLMQLLPDTAREVASRHGISMAAGLGDPALNLEIAAAMLADLMREFDGRAEVVAAAYAAGPAKARRWVREREEADLWLWTEAIPYDVVRSYAREIAVSTALYAAWLGEAPPAAHITVGKRL